MEHKHIHEHEKHCCCEHPHEHHHEHSHTHCDCGHEHHKHHHVEHCDCGHEHHHEHSHTHCDCGHDHHHEHSHEKEEIKNANYRFHIRNLDCANCALKIEKAIGDLPIVEEVSLNFSAQLLLIKSKEKEEKLLPIINQVANNVEPGVEIIGNKNEEKQSHTFEILQILVGLLLLSVFIVLETKNIEVSILFYLLLYAFVGCKVIEKAIRNILKKDFFDENFLMMIASIGAFIVGSYEEAVAVMLFYDLGEFLQSLAVSYSRKSIQSLMSLHSDEVTLIKDGKEIKVASEKIQVNDIIKVMAGERIAVDGIVVSGFSSLDVSALSGESLPKDIVENDEVLAGSLNINGVFLMKALKPVHESTVYRIIELVENASSKKAKIEKFITKFARVYTPFVVALALLVIFIPPVLSLGDFSTWLYRGCTFLVISCPCALVISIPLGLFAGIGAASKVGVLVKGGNYLEHLTMIDTLIFDKTGTITKGVFKVKEVVGNKDTLYLAALLESHSTHPIAQSICEAYKKEVSNHEIHSFKEIAGEGMYAIYKEKELLVGNHKLLKRYQIHFEECSSLGSVVYVAYDNIYFGHIIIEDEIKENARFSISTLKQLGIKKSVMLSGDKIEVAKSIAQEVGIDEVHGDLLPQDKVKILETYLNENSTVGFVGDGINDAPVLMRSDIGFAMGGIGSDAAIEASDIVLMNDDIMSIASAIKIAKKTKTILWQNIVGSLAIKFIVLLLAFLGFANMWMGVFADVGVTLIAVVNSMRALKL